MIGKKLTTVLIKNASGPFYNYVDKIRDHTGGGGGQKNGKFLST